MPRQKNTSFITPKVGLFMLCVSFMAFGAGGCDITQNHLKTDREASLEVQDFRDALAPRLPEVDEGPESAGLVPPLQPYIDTPTQAMKSVPLVSISVNQTVPLRDVLFELAEQADYDLELDPRIRGSVIFTARERPFDEVVERISAMAGLRYKFKDGVLRVELDKPYNKVYKVDYLSYIRKGSGNIRNNVAVVSGDGADTGSQFQATSESEADFWGELDVNLQQILGTRESGILKTRRDPRITATAQNPDVQAVTAGEDGNVTVSAPEAVLNVESLPTDEEEETSRRRGRGSRGREDEDSSTFSINQQAGLISVFATERQHKEVAKYLNLLKKSVTAQVLIEAKILQVELYDEYATGIDWNALGLLSGEIDGGFFDQGSLLGALVPGVLPAVTPGEAITGDTNFAVGYAGNDFQALIQALSGFGTVRGLASPRMTVLNNQPSVLNVATNDVFFEIDIDVSRDENNNVDTDIDTDIRNVPVGVLVNVMPSINLEDNTISLAVRPTITRVENVEQDPSVAFIAAQNNLELESEIPELNVQEIDTVIQVRSGQAVVMGGLLEDRIENDEEGVPVLAEVPILGSLFRDHRDLVTKTELVILLKATILENPSDSVHNTDRDLYRAFSSDRRPFEL